MSDANLSGANLLGADFHSADLNGAQFTDANLNCADFESANLSLANLTRANMTNARLVGAKMNDADLSETIVVGAAFGSRYKLGRLPPGISLEETFAQGQSASDLLRDVARTSLGNVDLSTVMGLEAALHVGPSSVGIDTLMLTAESLFGRKDQGQQAGALELFLRGAGVHEEALQLFPILLRHPVFYSVFISYSHKDVSVVERLEERLLSSRVSVWRDKRRRSPGAIISKSLREAIARHDRVVLICSEDSFSSGWVRDEVAFALERERETGRLGILIPAFVDESASKWTNRETGLFADRFGIDLRCENKDPVGFEREILTLIASLRTAQVRGATNSSAELKS